MRAASLVEVVKASQALNAQRGRVLIVDLNNFSTFPTLAVGILVGVLRSRAFEVKLISPLAHDVPAVERERADRYSDHLMRRVHLSTWPPFQSVRDGLRGIRNWWRGRPHPRVIRETAKALKARPDVILLSAYLQHFETVKAIGRAAQAAGVPVLLGGPMFNIEETAAIWRSIPGLSAVVGGEVDILLPQIVMAVCDGEDLLQFEGVTLPDGRRSQPARPVRDFDAAPIPDFTDFPWDRYRVRIIPIMTGRGCQWNRCNFCSDIISASGRTFRTRSVDAVLDEMREQARRHATTNFLFLDLKLNSNPSMLRGLVEGVQRHVPGAEWIGTVHVDRRRDSGLSRAELRAAVASGMRRVSFGLESGSQRLLDAMDKGCDVDRNEEFLRHAHEVGLSNRCTMFKGFPGEDAEDLELTAQFLERNCSFIDRIRYNEFSIPSGTPIEKALHDEPMRYPNLHIVRSDHQRARVKYVNTDIGRPSYRKAKARVLRAVFEINRRPIRSSARHFDGLM